MVCPLTPSDPCHGIFLMIRNTLRIPVHILEITRDDGICVLKNNGIYFMTDLRDFRQRISRAKFLLDLGEEEFARSEFSHALELVRGGLFKRMYDRWSEDLWQSIILEIEKYRRMFG